MARSGRKVMPVVAAVAAAAALMQALAFVVPTGRRAAVVGAAMPAATLMASSAFAADATTAPAAAPAISGKECEDICWDTCRRILGPAPATCKLLCSQCTIKGDLNKALQGLDEGDSIFKTADMISLQNGKTLRAISPW
eukprot:gb/GFBE01044797.1/.p4 GENE.gb/GFBE01044797.1/~~gb/GFBE01044797.1/.p4  ORF type:complete len:139 (-),score=39.64 gb/GFBE01044797.1/:93-509(-)